MDNGQCEQADRALGGGIGALGRRMPTESGYPTAANIPVDPMAYTAKAVTHPVTISKLLRGWIVQVGCQSVAFETLDKMLFEVGRYLRNPQDVEKEYLQKA